MVSKKPYKNKLSAISNINDVVKEELPVEVVEAAIFPEESVVQEITDTAPAPQVEEPKPLKVKVIHSSLRRRFGPSTAYDVAGIISDQGYYDIYEVKDNWGKLENGTWINLDYTDFQKI